MRSCLCFSSIFSEQDPAVHQGHTIKRGALEDGPGQLLLHQVHHGLVLVDAAGALGPEAAHLAEAGGADGPAEHFR